MAYRWSVTCVCGKKYYSNEKTGMEIYGKLKRHHLMECEEYECQVDMQAITKFKIRKKKCEMCGEKKPVVIIYNPNRFPANDDNKREDFWDVCKKCYEFVNWGMSRIPDVTGIDAIEADKELLMVATK